MEDDSIDMEHDFKTSLSIWKMTVSIWNMTVSMWNVLSLCLRVASLVWSYGTLGRSPGAEARMALEAAAYTRPLFSST